MTAAPLPIVLLVPVLMAGSVLVARAADHTNLEEGLPVTIEDAYQNGL